MGDCAWVDVLPAFVAKFSRSSVVYIEAMRRNRNTIAICKAEFKLDLPNVFKNGGCWYPCENR